MKEDIHNYEGTLKRTLERIKESKDILEENKVIILKFKEHMSCENLQDPTITRSLITCIELDKLLKKPFSEANKDDIKRVVAHLNERQANGKYLAEETKKKFKIMLRKLFRCIRNIDEKGVYPEEVKWITISLPKNSKKLPEELLTEEEIKLIIQNCKSLRDKALIATLAESGCRISEVGKLRLKCVSFEEYGARLTVDGKTGMRKILVINCVPYLQEWINRHPDNTNLSSFLWCDSKKRLLSYTRMANILKAAANGAGIKKKIYPHLLRHTRATFMASIMKEAEMKSYFGWGQDSKMCAIYIHMNGEATDAAILRANGIEIKKEKEGVSPMHPKICLRCNTSNEATNVCCKRCGLILDEKYANETIKKDLQRTEADEILNRLIKDPEILELIKKKL